MSSSCNTKCTSSTCYCYTGLNLPCINVLTNESLTDIVQKIEYELCLLLGQITTTTTSSSSSTTTTTTTTAQEFICFCIFGEAIGCWYTVQLPLLGNAPFQNGRPVYNFTGEVGEVIDSVYYDGEQWIYTSEEIAPILQPLLSSSYYPIGTYSEWGDATITGFMYSSTLGSCPPINICFSMGGEANGDYFCTVEPEVGLINGKPYYKLLLPDCTTQWVGFDEPVYIWFSTSGDYVNQWVVSELNNATIGNVYSYISSGGIGSYPIGTWEVLTDQIFVYNSLIGPCPASPA
jgi:hypothetical protein